MGKKEPAHSHATNLWEQTISNLNKQIDQLRRALAQRDGEIQRLRGLLVQNQPRKIHRNGKSRSY